MRILLLSTADTELLAARASGADYRLANPARVDADDVPALLDGVDLVVVRLLGGRRAWPDGLDAVLAAGMPTVVLGGEALPDAELMALSTVPAGVATEALAYLVEGGPDNLRELARFLSDTVLLTGEGFAPPRADARRTACTATRPAPSRTRPTVGVVFYRAHELAGEHRVRRHAGRRRRRGRRRTPLPVYCGSLRGLTADAGLLELLRPLRRAGRHRARGRRHGRRRRLRRRRRGRLGRGALAALDVPVHPGALPDQHPRAVGRQRRRR